MRRIRRGPPLLAGLRTDRLPAHGPSHSVYTDPLLRGLKGCVNSRTAIGPSRLYVDNPGLGDQTSILGRAGTLRPGHLGIVARGTPPADDTAVAPVQGPHAHEWLGTSCRRLGEVRRPLPGKAARGSPVTSCFQRRNRFCVIPRSRATWAVGCLPTVTSFKATCLNFGVKTRRDCPMLTTSWVSRPHLF